MDERPEDQDQTTERVMAPQEGVRIVGAEEAADALERGDGPPRLTNAESGRTTSRPTAPLPPWTDPPTGEMPRVFLEGRDDQRTPGSRGSEQGDDLDAWMGATPSAPRWRDHPNDWDEPDYLDLLEGESNPFASADTQLMGSVDEPLEPALGRSAASETPDFFSESFDPQPDLPPPALPRSQVPRVARGVTTVPPRVSGPVGGQVSSGSGSGGERVMGGYASPESDPGADLPVRVITGVAMAVVAVVLFSMGPAMAVVAALIVLVAAAAEFYSLVQRGGYQPATLVGLVATACLVLGTYWKGTMAQPLVVALTVATTLAWYLMGITRGAPTLNAGITVLGVGYVGVLGSFASLILRFDNGIGVLAGLIVAVVANDVGALFVGKRFGRIPLAPHISPNKTREGLIGGSLASIAASVMVLGVVGLHPWSVSSALLLGLVVSVMAPVGDLCESMIKRDIGVKDAGSRLPGHGGVLDRFDGLLFVLPAVYYLCLLIEVF